MVPALALVLCLLSLSRAADPPAPPHYNSTAEIIAAMPDDVKAIALARGRTREQIEKLHEWINVNLIDTCATFTCPAVVVSVDPDRTVTLQAGKDRIAWKIPENLVAAARRWSKGKSVVVSGVISSFWATGGAAPFCTLSVVS
jgi:hypothetical protein